MSDDLASPPSSRQVGQISWRCGQVSHKGERAVPEEVAVAFSYQNATHAVMMATPSDLADFAYGFSLTEGVVGNIDDIEELTIIRTDEGIVLRMMLVEASRSALWDRRRHSAGPSGCGLCGIESLAEAVRPLPIITSAIGISADAIAEAMAAMAALQPLNLATRAVHGAAFWRPGAPLLVREDIGRHNALDKLIGALARGNIAPGDGVILLTSRVSVELVQKAALAGAPILAAISAPTALAVKTADEAGITLVAVVRQDGFEVFSHPERIEFPKQAAHVA